MIPRFKACASHSAFGEHVFIFSAKDNTGCWPIFVFAVLASFRFKMHFLGVELDPFRTLKVHFDSVFQRLCLPLRVWGEHVFSFSAKNRTGCWPVFVLAVLALFRFKMHLLGVELDPCRTLKVQRAAEPSRARSGVQ